MDTPLLNIFRVEKGMQCRRVVVMPLILMIFYLSLSTPSVTGYTTMEIYGTVTDLNGNPIFQAKVVALDWRTLTCKEAETDTLGHYRFIVPQRDEQGDHEYVIYAYHRNPNTGAFDYVPSVFPEDIYTQGARVTKSQEVTFKLHPAATISLKGDEGLLWYVLSREKPAWFILQVVDSSTGMKPALNNSYIYVYGEPPFGYEGGPDTRFISNFINESLVVVPADIPIYVVAKAEFKNHWTGRLEEISFLMDTNGKPFKLSQGALITLDIRAYSYKFGVEALETVVGEVEERLIRAEHVGFYVGALREDLRSIITKVQEAKSNLPPIKPNPDEDTYIKTRYTLLEWAYDRIGFLEKDLSLMYATAQSHSVFFPFFFAVFIVLFASFLFENDRKKIFTALILYPLTILGLFYIYPGFLLITRTEVILSLWVIYKNIEILRIHGFIFFVAAAVLAITGTLSAFFLFPKIYKEPTMEGKTSLRSILAVIFSMGKRNIKRRKLRSFFCTLSLTVLVLGFTALTSFSLVYGIITEGPYTTETTTNMVLLQKIPPNETRVHFPSEFFSLDEFSSLEGRPEVEQLVPKVENIPSATPILRLKAPNEKKTDIYGVVGIHPSLEDRVTGIKNYIVGGQLEDNAPSSIVLSQGLADDLGLSIGDSLMVYKVSAGVETFAGNFTLAAFLHDSFFELSDANGLPFAPFKVTEAGPQKTDGTETTLLFWRAATNLHSLIGLSRVVAILKDPSKEATHNFANSMAHKEYVAYAITDGQATKYRIGTTLEVRGFEQFIVPFILVALNVAAVMLNLIHEREREIKLLSTLGLNAGHIASLFLAESAIMGFIGGGIGYSLGLGAYRLMTALGPAGQIGVRHKLEWYWAVFGLGVALLVSLLSTIRPAMRAAVMVTPSLVKKIKLPKREREKREKELFKVYTERDYTTPIRVHEGEAPFFLSYILDRLKGLTGIYQRFENIATEDLVMGDETRVMKISFTYTFTEAGSEYSTTNQLVATKKPTADYYSIVLSSKPSVPGLPERAVEITVSTVRDILLDWVKRRETLMSGGKR